MTIPEKKYIYKYIDISTNMYDYTYLRSGPWFCCLRPRRLIPKNSQIAAPFSVGHFAVWVFTYRTHNRLSWHHSWMPSGQLLILQLTLMPVRMPLLP